MNEETAYSGEQTPFISPRREFMKQVSAIGAGIAITTSVPAYGQAVFQEQFEADGLVRVTLLINGKKKVLETDPRVALLDALREKMLLTGTKKGCDRGQCGACTVLMNGRRVNSCLVLLAMCEGSDITTIEGLGTPDKLHPLQVSFIKHDAFQCGYCTPGQICSAIGLLNESRANTRDDVKELMSGNLCRCGANTNIIDAIMSVKDGGDRE